jgi:hypothetical protein
MRSTGAYVITFMRGCSPAGVEIGSTLLINNNNNNKYKDNNSLGSRLCRSKTTPGNNQIKHVKRDWFIFYFYFIEIFIDTGGHL